MRTYSSELLALLCCTIAGCGSYNDPLSESLDKRVSAITYENRIGALTSSGTLTVRQEAGTAIGWFREFDGAQDFKLNSSNQIFVLANDGTLYAKDGPLWSGWRTMIYGVKRFEVSFTRVGVLLNDNSFWIKEGSLDASWSLMHTNVTNFHIWGDRMAVLRSDDVLVAKDGSLSSSWVTLHDGVKDFHTYGGRIGVIRKDGVAVAKEGSLSASWTEVGRDVKSLQIGALLPSTGGPYIRKMALLTNSNQLYVIDNLTRPPSYSITNVLNYGIDDCLGVAALQQDGWLLYNGSNLTNDAIGFFTSCYAKTAINSSHQLLLQTGTGWVTLLGDVVSTSHKYYSSY